MTGSAPAVGHLRRLVWLDWRRLAGRARQPVGVLLTFGIPVAVVVSALWSIGRAARPRLDGLPGSVTLAMLVAGIVSFAAYGILFGGGDTGFLRRLGVGGRALMVERSGRLGLAGLGLAIGAALPYAVGGAPALEPWLVGISTASITAGLSVLVLSLAARVVVSPDGGTSIGIGIRQWDPELARTAPLVYAPLVPFLVGTTYGGLSNGGEARVWVAVIAIVIGVLAALSGAGMYEATAPRFAPRAGEIAFTPPSDSPASSFRVRGGVARLLPARASAIWSRDAIAGGRRFPWARRIVWPVVIAAVVALARWGDEDAARNWVLVTVGLALLVQGSAVIGLGLHERHGRRWVDRACGLRPWERYLGRVAWAVGQKTWLLVPVTLAWWWWSGAGNAWLWPLAGVAVASISAAISVVGAGMR